MSLLKYASKVSAFTLLSRFLGYFRDAIFAMSFGAKSGFDLFLLAFKIPNMMRRIFAEGAFSQAFIPVLAEYEEKSHDDKQAFLDAVFSCLCMVTLALSVIVCLSCEILIRLKLQWLIESEDFFVRSTTTDYLSLRCPHHFIRVLHSSIASQKTVHPRGVCAIFF